MKKSLIKRIGFLTFGLCILALGVAMCSATNLGTPPISTVPLITSKIVHSLSLGVSLILFHIIFFASEVIIVRKKFKATVLLQLPILFLFGSVVDVAEIIIFYVPLNSYLSRCVFCIIGVIFVGIGVGYEVYADMGMLPAEGFCNAISSTYNINYWKVKTVLDVSLVSLAFIVSITAGIEICIREGTIISALLCGPISNFVIMILDKQNHKRNLMKI